MPKRTPKTEAAALPTEGATVTHLLPGEKIDFAKPKRTAKQKELPGMESPKHPELDALVEMYTEQASALSVARFNIGETKVKIIELAEKLGLTVYRAEKISASLRARWARTPRGPGLAQMLAAAQPGECPFCGDPCKPRSSTADSIRKRQKRGVSPYALTCGEPECRVTAYTRAYQRDRRAA